LISKEEMSTGILIKKMVASFLFKAGLVQKRLRHFSRGRSCILMYHRVLPIGYPKKGIQPGMYVNLDTFEHHIRFLKDNFSLVSLDQIMNRCSESVKDAEAACALTFDDGWQDVFSQAFPVLKAHKVPATVFLPTDYIGTDKWFWTDRLGHLLYNGSLKYEKEKIETFHPLAQTILMSSAPPDARLEMAISSLKTYPNEMIEQILHELEECVIGKREPVGRAFLNWEEVREMADYGLIGFGSHTATHQILTTLEDNAIREELSKSREKLLAERVAWPDFIPFCYPNGNFNEKIARMALEIGYTLAVSTKVGWNAKTYDHFALKRIPVHEDMTSTNALFACRMAGIF